MLRMTTRPCQRIQNSSLYKIHPRISSPWKIQYYITLTLWCSLLSILLTLPVNAQYNSVDPPECQPSDVLYCLPRAGAQYNWTDPIRLVWRTSAQPFVTQGTVNIKLWRLADSKLCGHWDGITFSDGFIIRNVNESCFNGVVNAAAPVNSSNWLFSFKISSSNDNTSSLSDTGPQFYVYKYAQSTPSSPSLVTVVSTLAPSATSVAESASSASANSSKSKTFSPLLIAVISGAAVAVLVAIIAIFAATRARKRSRKHQSLSTMSTSSNSPMMIRPASLLGKGRKGDHDMPMEVSSIHSTTPLAKQTSVSSFTQKLGSGGIGIITQTTTTTSTTSIKPNSIQSSVSFLDSTSAIPITASDAAMISDAFRQTLRKPEWKPTEEEEEEEEEAQAGLSVEELQRRREAKELLRKELAEEGRGLQSVQRRQTKVLVHNVDEEDDTATTNTSTTLGPGSSVSGGQNQENSDSV